MNLFTNPKIKVLNKQGEPIVGAKMYIYQAGTDIKDYFYSNPELTTLLTNPILTDEYGDFPICYTENKNYKIILKDNKDNLLYSLDNINFQDKLDKTIYYDDADNLIIENTEYERDIIFKISNYDNNESVEILKINSATGEIQTNEDYKDNIKDSTTLINKGYIETNPPLPEDYITRLSVSFTDNSITISEGACKSSDNTTDIRLREPLTITFEEETIYAFTSGKATIKFPSETKAKILLVAGGGAAGGWDEATLEPIQPTNESII